MPRGLRFALDPRVHPLEIVGVLTSWISFRLRRAERLITGEAVMLIERGKVRREVMRSTSTA